MGTLMLARRWVAIGAICSVSCTSDRVPDADTLRTATTASDTVPATVRHPGVDTPAATVSEEPTGQRAAAPLPSRLANPLLATIRDTLRARNAAIGPVGIIEQQSIDDFTGPSVIVAYGVRADGEFQGNFQDELFGIFVANDSLTRIVRTIDVFPTPRWRDYSVRIVRLTPDSVRIEGRGASYGDHPLNRTYPLAPVGATPNRH